MTLRPCRNKGFDPHRPGNRVNVRSRALLTASLLLAVALAGCSVPDTGEGAASRGGEGARTDGTLYYTADGVVAEDELPEAERGLLMDAGALRVALYAVTALEDADDEQTFVARTAGATTALTYHWAYEAHSKPLRGTGLREVDEQGERLDVRFPMDGLYTLHVRVEETDGTAANDSILLRVGRVPEEERLPVSESWSGRFSTGAPLEVPLVHRGHLVGLADLDIILSWTSSTPGAAVRATVHQGIMGGAIASAGPSTPLDGRTEHRASFSAVPGNYTVRVEAERGLDVEYTVRIEGLMDPVRPVVPYEREGAPVPADEHGHPHP